MGDDKILGCWPQRLKLGEGFCGGPALPLIVEIAFVDFAGFHAGSPGRDPPEEAMVEGKGADTERVQIAKRAGHDLQSTWTRRALLSPQRPLFSA